jgi:hypothetical protein
VGSPWQSLHPAVLHPKAVCFANMPVALRQRAVRIERPTLAEAARDNAFSMVAAFGPAQPITPFME